MKVLLIRAMGLGDVASILVPAVRIWREARPDARIDVLTWGAGRDLMELVPGVDRVHAIAPEDWPDDLYAAVPRFAALAERIAREGYDEVVNLDTWFMVCVLARILEQVGIPVRGNTISMRVAELLARARDGSLTQAYFDEPAQYLRSTFPGMRDWTSAWWQRFPDAGAYPDFYLSHCCGLPGTTSARLPIGADRSLREAAQGRPVVALSARGSRRAKQYRQPAQLQDELQRRGFHVWTGFDGSVPMQRTLARLAGSDLLVTVPTSTQWLAKLVGCPSLMLPGPLPARVLGAEYAVDRYMPCQPCATRDCRAQVDYACMDMPARVVADAVEACLAGAATADPDARATVRTPRTTRITVQA